jgi:hypothetical protein
MAVAIQPQADLSPIPEHEPHPVRNNATELTYRPIRLTVVSGKVEVTEDRSRPDPSREGDVEGSARRCPVARRPPRPEKLRRAQGGSFDDGGRWSVGDLALGALPGECEEQCDDRSTHLLLLPGTRTSRASGSHAIRFAAPGKAITTCGERGSGNLSPTSAPAFVRTSRQAAYQGGRRGKRELNGRRMWIAPWISG